MISHRWTCRHGLRIRSSRSCRDLKLANDEANLAEAVHKIFAQWERIADVALKAAMQRAVYGSVTDVLVERALAMLQSTVEVLSDNVHQHLVNGVDSFDS